MLVSLAIHQQKTALAEHLHYVSFLFFFSVPNAAGLQQMANAADSQPITITNGQGQQITVIPTQSLQQQLRPANANIIQMPNSVPGLQAFSVQNIPGFGNVQVKISPMKLHGAKIWQFFLLNENVSIVWFVFCWNRSFQPVDSVELMLSHRYKRQVFNSNNNNNNNSKIHSNKDSRNRVNK